MRSAIKYFADVVYKPFLKKYLSKTRHYKYKGIELIVPTEVFHPAFFFSTKILLRHVSHLSLEQKTFLELGAGSGLISIFAATQKAIVTASDINPVAIQYLKKNSEVNHVYLTIIHSDLFQNIQPQHFDFIIINPPYYKKQPKNYKDYAWYCGENGEYFYNLFSTLACYINVNSSILMILSDACDFEMIETIASQNNFKLNCVHSEKNLLEKNFIYEVELIK